MTSRHVHHAQVVTAFVRIPEPLEDGKVRCLGCSAVVSLTPNAHIRKHRTPAGEDCAYTVTYADPVRLDELPPVQSRPTPTDVDQDARLAPRNGDCIDCGRWLPGERTLCGKCARRRNEEKKRH